MLDVLRANTAEPPSSTKELAELRVQNAKLTRDNQALLRRLESALASSTRFEHDLATVVRERDEWKRHVTKTSELVASFRNTVCVLELQLKESTRQANRQVDSCQQLADHLRRMVDQRDKDLKRMSEVLAERDVAYSALEGVASSYFEQVQEASARQKNVLRHNGRISVTDPALALAAAAGIDAPGLSPGDLALNARLCRLLETRWPELSQVQPSEVREITLRVSGPVAPSSAPVSLPLSSAAPTSNSSAAGLAMTPADFHSARKSSTEAAAGSSRRAPRNSAASPKSTSTVAPAPSITGSTQSQRTSALNARAINNLDLQALEASDAEVLGWSSGAANSAARATSASSPLVIDSPSPPVVTPTPAPVGASSSQCQLSSADSADDEVALQRSRRLRKKSVVESDESSDSVAEALEEKPASPPTPASVSPTPSTSQKRPSSPVAPASTKKARASASTKCSSPPRLVAKSTSRVRPTAKSSKAAKSATKTARELPSLASQRSRLIHLRRLRVSRRVLRCWLKCRGDRQEMTKVFVALYERMHWLVDSSVVLGHHPDLNPTSSADELALAYQLWQKYSHERKRRSDALRSVLTELYGTLYKAVTEFDAASNTPAP
ncbi:unnamed protein product [Phytophthora fragariaefolia]|uniref:Unnamed protein product n=1 Tax=Phytophthora fragariaefolia TaxID=1490495 RepID=A0A9W7D1U5_9STRA|nr:unnamed protein product [Phytophthora fragariaefolia]